MDMILDGAMIVTMDSAKNVYKDYAIAVEGDKIAAVAPREDIFARYPHIKNVRSCKGRVIFPGFVNIHTHTTLSIVRGVADDMGTAPAYTKSVPQGQLLSEHESQVMATLGAVGALRFGSTLIANNYTYSLSNVKAFSSLGMRAMVSERLHDVVFFGLAEGIYRQDEAMGQQLLQNNIDLIEAWDGKDNGRIRCCLGPHAPDTCTPGFLRQIADLADQKKVGLATHLSQSKGERNNIQRLHGTTSARYLDDCGILRPDLVAAHWIYVTDDDIQLLAKRGVHMAHAAKGNATGGMAAPMMKIREAGINVGIATDDGRVNMIDVMRMALCSARMLAGSCTQPQPMDILEMATMGGARAMGMEKEIGSIEVGKKADFVIIDYRKPHLTPCVNAVGNLVHTAQGNDVETVIIDGSVVVDDGKVLTIDTDALMREAQEIACRRWMEANDTVDPRLMLI